MTPKKEPMFSVIIPTRNRSDLLARAVAGVRAQIGAEFEIIIVDDGSSPEHGEATKALEGPDVLIVRLSSSTGRGHGASVTRNIGVSNSHGRYVAFCDDDDEWIATDHLASAADFLSTNPSAEYLFANQEAVTDGVVTNPDWLSELAPLGSEHWRRIERADVFRLSHFPHLNCTIVARSLFDRVGGMWQGAPYSQDLDFFLRAADAANEIAFRHRVIARHHVPDQTRSNNSSTSLSPSAKQLLYTMIANHVLACSTSEDVVANARSRAGWAYRHLVEIAVAERRFAAARALAILGLAARPSWRWLAYCCRLWLRR